MGLIDWIYDRFFWRRSQSSDGGLGAAVGQVVSKPETEPKQKPKSKAKGKFRIGVVVGHEKDSPGAKMAAPYNVHEYEYNSEIAELMFEYAHAQGTELEIFFRDGIGISGAYKKVRASKCDAVIELHFNAFNGKASGTSTLCSNDSEDVHLAETVQAAMVSLFGRTGTKNRGIKLMSAGGRGAQSCVSFPGRANCLVEPAFGDNPQDAKLLMELKRPYAHALVDAAIKALGGK